MGFFQDVGNWFAEMFQKFTDWVRQLLLDAINGLTIWIRTTMMGARRWLAEFMSTTHGFWIAIAFVIVGAVGLAYVGQTEWFLALGTYVKGWIQAAKDTTGLVLDWLGFTYWNTIHDLARIFVEDYAAWWEPIYQAFGTMSQELGLGIGLINTISRAGQQLAALGFMVAGADAAAAWITAESDRATWLEAVEERWMKYAKNPYAVFTDIDTELVFPAVEMLGEEFQRRWIILQEVNDQVRDIITGTENFEARLNQLIESLPEEFDIVRANVWDQFHTEFTRIYDETINPFLDKVNRAIAVVDDAILRQEIKVQALIDRILLPGSFLATILLLPEPFRTRELNILTYLFERAAAYEVVESIPMVEYHVTVDRHAALRAIVEIAEPEPDRTIWKITPPPKTPTMAIPGWYVGAY